MRKVHRLQSIQRMLASTEEAWKFFSDPHNLLSITPPFLNLAVTNQIAGNEIHQGQVITYKVKPFAGIAVSWLTEITHLEKQKMFVDEQKKGPYKLWRHQHHFRAIEGGTEMTDIVHYQLPMGTIGELAHPAIKRKLVEIFTYRFNKVSELFGNAGARHPDILID